MDLIKTGKIISEARKNKNMTQKELASKLHISDKAISKWERGLGYPDISFLIPLTKILDISLYELLSGEKEEVEETLKKTINYSNKELKRKNKEYKNKLIIIVVLISIVSIFIGYRSFNFVCYNLNFINNEQYQELIKGYVVKDVIEVDSIKLNESDYIEYQNIKLKNIFEGYEKTEENDYISYSNKEQNTHVTISKSRQFIEYLEEEIALFGVDDFRMNNLINSSFDKKINFKNDLELFEYLYDTRDKIGSMFESINSMKENYYIKQISFIMLPSSEYISEIKGDVTGYIINVSDKQKIKELHIFDEKENYNLLFMGIDNKTINEVLETLVIK